MELTAGGGGAAAPPSSSPRADLALEEPVPSAAGGISLLIRLFGPGAPWSASAASAASGPEHSLRLRVPAAIFVAGFLGIVYPDVGNE